MYWETEQKCSVYTKRMLTYIYFHQMANVAALIKAISGICANDIDTSTWNLPFNLVVPFDTRPVCGWFLKWMFELSCGFAYTLAMIIPTSYFFCFCMYIVAICKHFEMLVDRIRLDVQWIRAGHKSRRECEHMWNKLRKNVFQLIDIHSNVMEYVLDHPLWFPLFKIPVSQFQHIRFGGSGEFSCDFLSIAVQQCGIGLIVVHHGKCRCSPICCGHFLFVCFSIVCLQSGGDGIVIDVICVICALMWCSLFCYFGDVASDRLFSIGYASFSSNWYDFPIGWQKSIVLIILRSQQRVQFNGLNLINCTVEVLGKASIPTIHSFEIQINSFKTSILL